MTAASSTSSVIRTLAQGNSTAAQGSTRALPVFAPSRQHCTFMSGITAEQLKLMTLYGALQAVEWMAVEAQHVCAGPAPIGNPGLHDQLMKLQLELNRGQSVCLEAAYPRGVR